MAVRRRLLVELVMGIHFFPVLYYYILLFFLKLQRGILDKTAITPQGKRNTSSAIWSAFEYKVGYYILHSNNYNSFSSSNDVAIGLQ